MSLPLGTNGVLWYAFAKGCALGATWATEADSVDTLSAAVVVCLVALAGLAPVDV